MRIARLTFCAIVVWIAAVAVATASARQIPLLNPQELPRLPGQGLILSDGTGVLLETTSGRVIGRLAGYVDGPPENLPGRAFGRSLGFGALAAADPQLTFLYDRAGN